jgi:hypothetical protein
MFATVPQGAVLISDLGYLNVVAVKVSVSRVRGPASLPQARLYADWSRLAEVTRSEWTELLLDAGALFLLTSDFFSMTLLLVEGVSPTAITHQSAIASRRVTKRFLEKLAAEIKLTQLVATLNSGTPLVAYYE